MKLFRTLYAYRFVFMALVQKEFKVRYSQSLLGMSWLILEPMFTVLTFSVVFSMIGRQGAFHAPYPVSFYSGLIIWNFFNSCLNAGTKSFIADKALWSKMDFPRILIIIKNLQVYMVDMLLASIPMLIVFAVFGYWPTLWWLLTIPLFLLVVIFGTGVMLIMASINVYLRDVGLLVKTLGTVWFWMTPVIFVHEFSGASKILYYVNPMAGIVRWFHHLLLAGKPAELESLYSILIAAPLTLLVGYFVYRKLQKGFADVV